MPAAFDTNCCPFGPFAAAFDPFADPSSGHQPLHSDSEKDEGLKAIARIGD